MTTSNIGVIQLDILEADMHSIDIDYIQILPQ